MRSFRLQAWRVTTNRQPDILTLGAGFASERAIRISSAKVSSCAAPPSWTSNPGACRETTLLRPEKTTPVRGIAPGAHIRDHAKGTVRMAYITDRQVLDRQRVDLRDSGFANPHQFAHLAHGEFLLVVQHEHLLLTFRQMGDCLLQSLACVRWPGRASADPGLVDPAMFWARSISCPSPLASHCRLPISSPRISLSRCCNSRSDSPSLFRQFRPGNGTSQLRLQLLHNDIDLPRLPAQITRAPVHLAQAVENGATNAEFRVRGELYVLL